MATPISDLRDVCDHPPYNPSACPDRPLNKVCTRFYPGENPLAPDEGIALDFNIAAYERRQHMEDAAAEVDAKHDALATTWQRSWGLNLRAILAMDALPVFAILTFAAVVFAAFVAHALGARIDGGDVTVPDHPAFNWLLGGNAGVKLALLIYSLWFFFMHVALLPLMFLRRRRASGRVAESVETFFAKEIDQWWIDHLRAMLARLGDGDRSVQTDNVSRRAYHILCVWRRIERFSARLEPSVAGYRGAVEETRPLQFAIRAWIGYAIIVFLGYNLWILTVAGSGGAGAQDFDDLRRVFDILILLALPAIMTAAWRLRISARAVGDRIEDALLMQGGVRRRAHYADLDPYPLIVERHRSALDDLEHLIT